MASAKVIRLLEGIRFVLTKEKGLLILYLVIKYVVTF